MQAMQSSRRPVPSNGALRFLRQLAYISSGAACGTAALLVEEQRRQTCLAKKIVNNARILKQHSRRSHAGVAVAAQEQSFDFLSFDHQLHETGDNARYKAEQQSSKTNGIADLESSHGAKELHNIPRNGLLPSEVDKGYKSWRRREQRDSEQAVQNRSLLKHRVSQDPLEHGQKSSKPNPASDELARRRRALSRKPSTMSTEEQIRSRIQEEVREGRSDGAFVRLLLHAQMETATREQRGRLTGLLRSSISEITRSLSGPTVPLSAGVGSIVVDQLVLSRSIARAHAEDVSVAIKDFCNLFPARDAKKGRSIPRFIDLATQLLDRAAHLGLVESVHMLIRWLYSVGARREHSIRVVCENVGRLRNHANLDRVCALYQLVLLRSGSDSMPREELHRLKLEVFGHLLLVAQSNAGDSARLRSVFAKKLFGSVVSDIGIENALRCLGVVCREFYQSDLPEDARSAVELFCCCTSPSIIDNDAARSATSAQTFDVLFEDSSDSLDIDACLALIDWKQSHSIDFENETISLLRRCVKTHSNEMLLSVYARFRPRHHLPSDLYAGLLEALAAKPSLMRTSPVLRDLPSEISTESLLACQSAWAILLTARWRSTRNFKLVKSHFQAMSSMVSSGQTIPLPFTAMLGVCVRARQYEEVKDILRQMREIGEKVDPRTFGYILLAAAKEGKWRAVDEMLASVGKEAFAIVPVDERAHIFNPVLAEYAAQMKPEQVHSFAIGIIGRLQVQPTKAMFSIVFKAHIRGRSFSKLAEWLQYLRSRGLQARVDASDAVDALKTFYYEFRPAYWKLAHLIRRLSASHHLISQELHLLLLDAVTFDTRHDSGRHADDKAAVANNTAAQVDASFPELQSAPPAYNMVDVRHIPSAINPTPNDSSAAKRTTIDILPASQAPNSKETESVLPTYSDNDSMLARQVFQGRKMLESKMLLAMSTENADHAVTLYEQSLSGSGLPLSFTTLNIALEASLQAKHGDMTQAFGMLHQAQAAGMNVTMCVSPLTVGKMQKLDREQIGDLVTVLREVTACYRAMDENDVQISHHHTVAAAHRMMNFGRHEKAVALLRNIQQSDWHKRCEFDIAAMTVFLQGYVKLGNALGIRWVINQVLGKNIRIDRKFLLELNRSQRTLRHLGRTSTEKMHLFAVAKNCQRWRTECQARQVQQIRKVDELGNALMDTLIECSPSVLEGPQNRDAMPRTLSKEVISGHEESDEGASNRRRRVLARRLHLRNARRTSRPRASGRRTGIPKLALMTTHRFSRVPEQSIR